MEKIKITIFVPKTKEEVKQMSTEDAKERLKVLDTEFQKISENPKLDEKFSQAREPIDLEFHRIFDQFPELQKWYDDEQ